MLRRDNTTRSVREMTDMHAEHKRVHEPLPELPSLMLHANVSPQGRPNMEPRLWARPPGFLPDFSDAHSQSWKEDLNASCAAWGSAGREWAWLHIEILFYITGGESKTLGGGDVFTTVRRFLCRDKKEGGQQEPHPRMRRLHRLRCKNSWKTDHADDEIIGLLFPVFVFSALIVEVSWIFSFI